MPAMLCFPRDKASPLWTNHADFNDFLAQFTDALYQSEPSTLLACFRPNSDLWCLARAFGPACIRSLIGLFDDSTFLSESNWFPGESESCLIWSFSSGSHATLVIENRGDSGWFIQEVLPFDPRGEGPDDHAREAYRQFLNQPPKEAVTGNAVWNQMLQVILRDPPLKASMPLYSYFSETVPLARHLSEILTFFEHLSSHGWQILPWISIRDSTYVFRAKHEQSAQCAAVKWLSDGKANFMKNFYKEIELLRDIENMPGTPTYLDHGESAGRPYHLCHWETGHSLELEPNYFKTLPMDRKIRIAMNTLRTVVYIHNAGLLHRDIAPDHLLVRKNDEVTLLDFGMSSHIETLDDAAFRWFMENELSNLGFTLHTLLVGGISFPFGDTRALQATWPKAEVLLNKAPLEKVWKQLIQACIEVNPRINTLLAAQTPLDFSLENFLKFRLRSHFQTLI